MNIINLHDKNLYFIGGVVRDEILGKESFDIDLTYVGNAIEFAKNIPTADIVQINEPFGTVRIVLDGEEIDIASTRFESYPRKGHLPVVDKIACSLKEDVLRRDFTINALAKSTLTNEIIDYTNGLEDIKNKTIRVLHDKSFVDDPTRIVRALKFAVRFGFELDEHTKHLQDLYLTNINYDMSYKRLKKELIETFNLNSWQAFEKFVNQGIYKLIAPENFKLPEYNFVQLIEEYKPKNIWIIYIGLLPNITCLPLTKAEAKIISDFDRLKEMTFNSDFEIYQNLKSVSIESIIMYSTINSSTVDRYLLKLKDIKIEITGKDLQNLGIKPSEKYQECFDFILKEKLKNQSMSFNEEILLAKKFFSI